MADNNGTVPEPITVTFTLDATGNVTANIPSHVPLHSLRLMSLILDRTAMALLDQLTAQTQPAARLLRATEMPREPRMRRS